MRRRVVVTGMGAISSAGANLEEARAHFITGTCCLSAIDDPRMAHLRARFAGLLRGFDPKAMPLPEEFQLADNHVRMALVAAREALMAARVEPARWGRRLGFIFATCSGPMLLIEEHYERILRGEPRISAEELFAKRYYSGALVLARALSIQGLTMTVVTACTASTAAIALATDLIRCGMLDAALAGGADSFSTSTLAGFDGLKATAEGRCAPFSKPFGLNLGEAGAFVFLETPESPQQRGAPIRAEILGSGTSNDAYHCSAPDPSGRGLASAMTRALRDAGLPLEQISYVNAHGTGTEANDKSETRAIRKVFGPLADRLPVSSTKSLVGHCLGAAGAIELIASVACAESGVLPATANFTEPREGCSLDYVPDTGRAWPEPRVFLSNNAAFGGHNASLTVAVPGKVPGEASAAKFQSNSAASTAPIVITGIGLVSSLGLGTSVILEALSAGGCGIQPTPLPGLSSAPAGLVDQAVVERFDRRLDLREMDRSSRFATVATRMALREAGYPEKPQFLAELGLFLNLSAGPSWAESEFLTSFLRQNRQVTQLAAFPYIVPCSVAGNVCRALRLTGHNLTLSLGPGAGLLGLGPALAALRNGHAQALLTGAVDELSERILSDQVAAGLVKPDCPPGEGAAVFLMETAAHTQARGAQPIATLCSWAAATGDAGACDSGTALESLTALVSATLAQSGIRPENVSAICFQGPHELLAQISAQLCPQWLDRGVTVARGTGELESAQLLLDLAAALTPPPAFAKAAGHVLAILCSPHGENCAAVFRRG